MKKHSLSALRALFACAAVLVAACLPTSSTTGKPKEPVRLLYWNIQNGMWDGQEDNYSRFVEWVRKQNPDICVWCEGQTIYLTGTADQMPKQQRYLPDNWGELARRYGHNYWYISAHRDDYPQIITSRYPITNIKRITGDSDTTVTHGASWTQIEIAGQTLNIVTLHTWPMGFAYGATDRKASQAQHGGNKYRRKEMEYICNHTILSVAKAEKQYWMMMGDFNSVSRSDNATYGLPDDDTAFLVSDYVSLNTPYIDVIKQQHPHEFLTTTGGKRRIDFVYCSPKLYKKVVSTNVISDDYTTPVRNARKLSNFWHPSDHRPIIVDFKLKKP